MQAYRWCDRNGHQRPRNPGEGRGLDLGLGVCVSHSHVRQELGEYKYTSSKFAEYRRVINASYILHIDRDLHL